MNFKNTEVWGFSHALRGMRNALESWERNDSYYDFPEHPDRFIIGKNDMELAQKLIIAGNEHSKFMRMIHVAVDANMPRYWWSEADTYHFNTKNSCSTMHKLLNNTNPITLDMFVICDEDKEWWSDTIDRLEKLRRKYKEIQSTTKNSKELIRLLVRAKRMLPEGLLQMRTWDTTYAELRNMYFQRRHHKLRKEWVNQFCEWVESLPYAKELICLEKTEAKN